MASLHKHQMQIPNLWTQHRKRRRKLWVLVLFKFKISTTCKLEFVFEGTVDHLSIESNVRFGVFLMFIKRDTCKRPLRMHRRRVLEGLTFHKSEPCPTCVVWRLETMYLIQYYEEIFHQMIQLVWITVVLWWCALPSRGRQTHTLLRIDLNSVEGQQQLYSLHQGLS